MESGGVERALRAQIISLEETIELQRQKIKALELGLTPLSWSQDLGLASGLTPTERAIFNYVALSGRASKELLCSVSAQGEGSIRTFIRRINVKLAPQGYQLKAIYGFGYQLLQNGAPYHVPAK